MMGAQSACIFFFRLIFSSEDNESETNTTLTCVILLSQSGKGESDYSADLGSHAGSVRSVAEEFLEIMLPLTLGEYAQRDCFSHVTDPAVKNDDVTVATVRLDAGLHFCMCSTGGQISALSAKGSDDSCVLFQGVLSYSSSLIFSDIVKRGASLYRFGRQCQPFTSPLQPTSHVSHKLVMEGLACVCSYFYISFNLREYAGAVTHSREV